MPDYTDNILTFAVPGGRLEEFMTEIEGPSDWPVPVSAFNGAPNVERTAHEIFGLKLGAGRTAETIRAARAAATGAPDWMPLCFDTVAKFAELEGKLYEGRTPFSIPRLAPIQDMAEFQRFFPGQIVDGFWAPHDRTSRDWFGGRLGTIALNTDRIGVKWLPSEVHTELPGVGSDGYDRVEFQFTSPWEQITNLETILAPILSKFHASVTHVWHDEHANSGFVFLDPTRGIVLEDDFGDSMSYEDAEDDPEFPMQVIDLDRLLEEVGDLCAVEIENALALAGVEG